MAVKTAEAQAAATASTEATAQLQVVQGHSESLQLQLGQAQQALKHSMQQVNSAQQKALAEEARLNSALKAKAAELKDTKEALATSQASLQVATAGVSELASLQEQVTGLQAKLSDAEGAHSSLLEQCTDSQLDAASLTAAAEARDLDLLQTTAALSEKQEEVQQLKVSVQEAQDRVVALQTALTELQSTSGPRDVKLNKAQLAFKKLKKQHEALQQAASAKEAALSSATQAKDAELQQVVQAAAKQGASLQDLTAAQQASVARVASLESAMQDLTEQCEELQQQLSHQRQACDELKLQHADRQAKADNTHADSAAATEALHSELSLLKEMLPEKEAKVEELAALLKAAQQQICNQRPASSTLHKVLPNQQTQTNASVTSADSAPAELLGVPDALTSADLTSTPAATQGGTTGPVQQETKDTQTADPGDAIAASASQVQHLQALLLQKEKDHTELKRLHSRLRKQLQASAPKLAETAERTVDVDLMGDRLLELEASLKGKDAVIQKLQHEVANSPEVHTYDQSTGSDAKEPVTVAEAQPLHAMSMPLTALRVPSSIMTPSPSSPVTSDTIYMPPSHDSNFESSSLAGSHELESEPVSSQGASPLAANSSAASLSMPEGSVNNPLADQSEPDDHHTPAGMPSLSPPMSSQGLISNTDGITRSDNGVPASSGLGSSPSRVAAAKTKLHAAAVSSLAATAEGALKLPAPSQVCCNSWMSCIVPTLKGSLALRCQCYKTQVCPLQTVVMLRQYVTDACTNKLSC